MKAEILLESKTYIDQLSEGYLFSRANNFTFFSFKK